MNQEMAIIEQEQLPSSNSLEAKIGARIRSFRVQRGLSQGDIEERTGLLRCYLSRVENGHTTPSLGTLAKIAKALEVCLPEFFNEQLEQEQTPVLIPALTEAQAAFIVQLHRYAAVLNENSRMHLRQMIQRMCN